MLISFVIPLYNEEKRVQKSVREILAFREGFPHEMELIFVDDGSTDRTEEIAREELGSVPYRWIRFEANRGKGAAVRAGMLLAEGDYLFFTDADLSTPLEEYSRLLAALQNGKDAAIASRGPGAQVLVHQNVLRESMGRIFNRIARLFSFEGISDSQCGFKAFRREAAKELFGRQRLTGFSFDAEILYLAQRLGYRIAEIPVTWINSPESRVRILRDSLNMVWDLFRIHGLHRDLKGRLPVHAGR